MGRVRLAREKKKMMMMKEMTNWGKDRKDKKKIREKAQIKSDSVSFLYACILLW